MNIAVRHADELTAADLAVWSDLQQRQPVLHNPFFSHQFTRIVNEVRGTVEVAVLRRGGETVGFLPFERVRRHVGKPVATQVSEIQGAIIANTTDWELEEVFRAAGLSAWIFDAVPTWQQSLSKYRYRVDDFPFIDLRDGFDSYCRARKASGSKQLEQVTRKARKIEREVGPLRFEFHTDDISGLRSLQAWKSAQYRKIGAFNVFSLDWVRELIHRLGTVREETFSGVVSTLTAGDELIAIHMGIRSANVLGWWFPAYNTEFAKYSPGSILLVRMLMEAPHLGIERIDLGRGPERYKASFRSDSFTVAEGAFDRRSLRRSLRRAVVGMRDLAGSSPWGDPALRFARRCREWIGQRSSSPSAE